MEGSWMLQFLVWSWPIVLIGISLDWDLLALHTMQGFSIQSDFYLAQGTEKRCEATAARPGGSFPLSPVQGIHEPKIMTLC